MNIVSIHSEITMQKILLGLLLLIFTLPLMAADEPEKVELTPGYVSMGEAMVLNLATDSPRLTFVQLKADVLVRDENSIDSVKLHMPALRHQVILMLSEQDAAKMKSPVEREKLRKQISDKVRSVYKELTGKDDIEEVLFSNFLVQ
jgi:flagellar protein FliL